MPNVANESGCWYEIYVFACPVCGREKVYRERRPPPRPEQWERRHHYEESYDWCDAL